MKISTAKGILLWIVEIFIVLLLAFVLVYCAGMRVSVVGNSMESTLSDGSVVLVNRFVYNIKEPKAGDVIVRFPWKSDEKNFDPETAIQELGEMAELTFRGPDNTVYIKGSDVSRSTG